MKTNSIGEQISLARQQKNLTQSELAYKCHLDIRTIQRIEKGEVSPRAYTLRIINDVLELELTFKDKGNSNEELAELRKKFKRRKDIRFVGFVSALVFLVLVSIYIVFIERHFNIPRLAWTPFVYIIMFAYIAVITISWRCPGCGGLLGDVFNTWYCSKCGLEFYD